jgi:hypothetical protein
VNDGISAAKAVSAALAVIGVIAVVVIIGWQANWWFASHNAQRTAQVVQQNYNVQQGYLADITNDVAAIDANIATAGSTGTAGAISQNIHSGDDACHYAELLIPGEVTTGADMQTWIKANCADGALVPGSSVYQGGNGE